MDRSQRLGRWLFNFLHSWDLPLLLQAGWVREAVLIVLSMGGIALGLTSLMIAFRRMSRWYLTLKSRGT